MQKKRTICLFTDSLEPSGVGEHMLALTSELNANFDLLFACPPTPKGTLLLARARDLGCQTLALDIQKNHERAYGMLGDWLHKHNTDLFHCHAGIGWEGHEGIYVARRVGVPLVIRTEHLPYLITEPTQQLDYQAVVRQVDRLICVSQEAFDSYQKVGIPFPKLALVRNGISVKTVNAERDAVRTQLGLSTETALVLTIARLTEQKGHRYLLEAIPAVVAEKPQTCFLWVGEGPLEEELRQQMVELGVKPSHLIFAGWRSDVPQLLAASDLFVLPSLFEGLPLVALEAMANGIPVIGTKVCGTSEAIEDGVSGRLVEAASGLALSEAILDSLIHPEVTSQWATAARQRIQEYFSAKRMSEETCIIYEREFVHDRMLKNSQAASLTFVHPRQKNGMSNHVDSTPDNSTRVDSTRVDSTQKNVNSAPIVREGHTVTSTHGATQGATHG